MLSCHKDTPKINPRLSKYCVINHYYFAIRLMEAYRPRHNWRVLYWNVVFCKGMFRFLSCHQTLPSRPSLMFLKNQVYILQSQDISKKPINITPFYATWSSCAFQEDDLQNFFYTYFIYIRKGWQMESYRYYNKLLSVLSSCFPAFEINFTIEEINITVSYIKKKRKKKKCSPFIHNFSSERWWTCMQF